MKKTILLLFITLTGLGCTEPFTIETRNSPPVPVIYGVLTDEWKEQEIMISRSSAYFDNRPNEGIFNAQVVVQSSDNETFRFVEKYIGIPGLYVSEDAFAARIGTEYKLSVTMDFDDNGQPDHYEASTTILPPVAIDSIVLNPEEFMGRKLHVMNAYFQDPAGRNYLMFHVFYNDSLLTAKISDAALSNDELFDGQQVAAIVHNFPDISEKEKDKWNSEQQRRRVYLSENDKVEAAVSLVPKGYFDFITDCQKEQRGENPMFGGPASNITTNINNGLFCWIQCEEKFGLAEKCGKDLILTFITDFTSNNFFIRLSIEVFYSIFITNSPYINKFEF